MKFELLIIACTAFLAFNTYYDGYYLKMLMSWKKYYLIASYVFLGLCAYLFIKRNPSETHTMFAHANNIIKSMPIDKDSMDFLTPVLDFTKASNIMPQQQNVPYQYYQQTPQFKRMMNSGSIQPNSKATKRSVSETKKKFIASQQHWKCGNCSIQLPAWFEVDHKVKLEHGGSNHISNLVALCRDCHGKKTTMENL
tara:strand:- start:5185 stop:5772 length:588 start_codon:yes stop_codon:yes gene_type:complete